VSLFEVGGRDQLLGHLGERHLLALVDLLAAVAERDPRPPQVADHLLEPLRL
jgi:hypothetical protein